MTRRTSSVAPAWYERCLRFGSPLRSGYHYWCSIPYDFPSLVFSPNYLVRSAGGERIGNLLHDGCVEVACLVDHMGVHPIAYGNLPSHMAAVCRSNMSVFDLGAQAAIDFLRTEARPSDGRQAAE